MRRFVLLKWIACLLLCCVQRATQASEPSFPVVDDRTKMLRAAINGTEYKKPSPPIEILKKESAVEEKVSQGSSTRQSVSPANGLAAKPSPPLPVQKKAMHSHKCPSGHVWVHDNHSFGDTTSHACPICGKVQFNVYQENVQVHDVVLTPTSTIKPSATPVTSQVRVQQSVSNCPSGNCPNGNCPVSQRRRSRR